MRIGFFTNTYHPICYGSVVSIESFRKNLEKLGHEVYVFAPGHGDYKDKNKRVFRYPSFVFKYKIDYPISIPLSSFINDKIKELNLDIIHVHQPFSLGREGLKYARKLNIPVVFTYHAKYEDYIHYVPFFLPGELLADLIKKEAVNFANKCNVTITPSQGIRRIIQRRGVNKKSIEVLPTGIDWGEFQKGEGDKIRKKHGIKKDEILCLNIGRVNKEKNLILLLKATRKVIEKNPKVKMMFIGEGFLRKKLRNMSKEWGIENNIIFTGFIQHGEIKDYLKATNIYLQASRSETQGLTILEAMAVGVPIVAVKATGTEDFIINGKNGILTENKINDFAERIDYLIKNPKIQKKLSKQAFNDSKKFTEKKQTKKLELIYKGLV